MSSHRTLTLALFKDFHYVFTFLSSPLIFKSLKERPEDILFNNVSLSSSGNPTETYNTYNSKNIII